MARVNSITFDARHAGTLARYVLVEIPGVLPRIFFQTVPEDKVVKNRVHLDLECDDLDAEIQRLVALGAAVYATHDNWVTLLDPQGNEFCVLAGNPDRDK